MYLRGGTCKEDKEIADKEINMEKQKVSIIVPVYKTEKYLEECLDSIAKQTYSNIEIILIDDGSPDGCGKICDKYRAKDSRFIVVHKENEGLGYTRNCGLDIATGDYVTFVDSDDYLEPNMISHFMNQIAVSEADTCMGGFRRVDDNHDVVYTEGYEKVVYTNNQIRDILLKRILGSIPKKHDSYKMSVWNVIYSMEIIKRNHMRFPSEKIFISEDLIFNFDYYMKACKVCITDNITYNYRVNENSLTRVYKSDMLEKVCVLYKEMEKRIIYLYKNDENEALYRLQTQFLINIRSCIQQECLHNSKCERLNALYDICNNKNVREVVCSYPMRLLDIRQYGFVIILRFKMIHVLGFCFGTLHLL